MKPNENMKDYRDWLNRIAAVRYAYHQRLIRDSDLPSYQLFILEFGQVNANFTLRELTKLRYQKSPFMPMRRHTYLRGTDFWATEVLQKCYEKDQKKCYEEDQKPIGIPAKKNPPGLYPIFIDSEHFWTEVKRYFTCHDYNATFTPPSLEAVESEAESIWIKLENAEDKEGAVGKIRNKLLGQIIDRRVKLETEEATNTLKEALKKTRKVYSPTEKKHIREFLVQYLAKARTEEERKKIYQSIKKRQNLQNTEFLKKHKIKKPKQLCKLPQNAKAEYQELLAQLSEEEKKIDRDSNAIYSNAITKWKDAQVESPLGKFYYFMEGKFEDIETLVLVGHRDAKKSDSWGPKAFVNQLGYRADPVRLIRAVLNRFPKLFIDEKETNAFLEYLRNSSMIKYKDLSSSEKEIIEAVFRAICQIENPIQVAEPNFPTIFSFPNSNQEGINFYASLLAGYKEQLLEMIKNQALKCAVLSELTENLSRFKAACFSGDLVSAIRAAQAVTEIFRLSFSILSQPSGSEPAIQETICSLVSPKTSNYRELIQATPFTTYGMRSYTRILQLNAKVNHANNQRPNIFVTNQSYFEWLLNLRALRNNGTSVKHTRFVEELDESADIIFMEIHPNNATETKQFSQDPLTLLEKIDSFQHKPRTLVVDATLNALNDNDIHSFLSKARPLVESGRLNIVLIQSLTKFSQVGMDQRSGGLMVVINNGGDFWCKYNQYCKTLMNEEPIDVSTLNHFSYFLDQPDLIRKYITLVNSKVSTLYQLTMGKLEYLDTGTRQKFQLTMSSDPGSCYVALNFRGILAGVDRKLSFTTEDIERFGEDIINQFLIPICNFLNLPITQRMSIGFPMSSVNCMLDTLRFTVGLETEKDLKNYAEVIAYISLVLNRLNPIDLLFEKDSLEKYSNREGFFSEKVEQFKAITPNKNVSHSLAFKGTDAKPRESLTISMRNGELEIKQGCQCWTNKTIAAHTASLKGPKPLGDISANERRMILSGCTRFLPWNEQHMEFHDFGKTIVINFEFITLWKCRSIYGPFVLDNGKKIHFELFNRVVKTFYPGKTIPQSAIRIRQDKMLNPFEKMPFDERDFLFKAAGYEYDRAATDFHRHYPKYPRVSYQYMPLQDDKVKISIESGFLVFERDFVAAKREGITIYKRFFDQENTGIEIDYWGEKDPIICRFFCFAIAVCANTLQNGKKRGFKARRYRPGEGSSFSHLLFHVAFDLADAILADAMEKVFTNKTQLNGVLKQWQEDIRLEDIGEPKPRQCYSFFNLGSDIAGTNEYSQQLVVAGEELANQVVSATV